jgi:hypothetical protein
VRLAFGAPPFAFFLINTKALRGEEPKMEEGKGRNGEETGD